MKPEQPVKVYGNTRSGHVHRVRLLLSLLQIPEQFIGVDTAHGEHKRPEFLAKNPFGLVPVIEDGPVTLYDSNAILVYLATRYGGERWLPRDAVGAAQVQQWFSLAAGEIRYGPANARAIQLFGRALNLEHAQETARNLFSVLDRMLANRKFALGEIATVADVSAYSYIAVAPEGGIALDPYPNLVAWLRNVEALPNFLPMPRIAG